MAKYFTLKELCATRHTEIDNFPTFEIVEHLKELAETLLDPLREAWGGPVHVTSGYRCDKLNKAVGGSATSVHPKGWAADLQPANGKTEDFIGFVRTWVRVNGIKFDQLIRETDDKGSLWLHIGLYSPDGKQRQQIKNLKK